MKIEHAICPVMSRQTDSAYAVGVDDYSWVTHCTRGCAAFRETELLKPIEGKTIQPGETLRDLYEGTGEFKQYCLMMRADGKQY